MMFNIDAKELAELFPFAARRVVAKCEAVVGKAENLWTHFQQRRKFTRSEQTRP
jgi:hypothetical protein